MAFVEDLLIALEDHRVRAKIVEGILVAMEGDQRLRGRIMTLGRIGVESADQKLDEALQDLEEA